MAIKCCGRNVIIDDLLNINPESLCAPICLTVTRFNQLPDPAEGCETALVSNIQASGFNYQLWQWDGSQWVGLAFTSGDYTNSEIIDVNYYTDTDWVITLNGIEVSGDSAYTFDPAITELNVIFINTVTGCEYAMEPIIPPVPELAFTYYMDRQAANSESSFVFHFSEANQSGHIDWGDGSPIEAFSTNADTFVVVPHTYVATGLVEFKLYLHEPTKWIKFEDYYANAADAYDAVWESNVTTFTEFIIGNSYPNYFTALPTFPSTIEVIDMSVSTLLETVDVTMYPNLTNWNFNDSNQITSILSSGLANLDTINAGSCALLTSVDIENCPLLVSTILTGSALTTASISDNLIDMDATGLNNGTYSAASQVPVASLTAGGVAAKASLEGKGWTVTVDV